MRRRRRCGQRPRGDLGEGEGLAGDVQQRGLAGGGARGRGGVPRGGIRSGGGVKTGEVSGGCGGSERVAALFYRVEERRVVEVCRGGREDSLDCWIG